MLKRLPVTVTTTILVVLTYLAELTLAGTVNPQAAYTYLLTVIDTHTTLLWILSPFLHSSHTHITQNLLFFIPFAVLIEHRTDSTAFLIFLVAAGYLSTIVNSALTGSIGVGLSAVMYAVQSREATYRAHLLWRSPALPYRQAFKHSSIVSLTVVLVGIGLAQALGYLSAPSGTALTAHVAGILIGISWLLLDIDSVILTEAEPESMLSY